MSTEFSMIQSYNTNPLNKLFNEPLQNELVSDVKEK